MMLHTPLDPFGASPVSPLVGAAGVVRFACGAEIPNSKDSGELVT